MPKGQAKQAIKSANKKKDEQKKKKKHHSKTKPDAKHSSGGGGGGGGKSKAKVAAPKDADSRQKSFEHHLHGREVLPQMQKHEPKTKPESRDDLLGEALAAEEKQHKIEHHQHVKEARHHAVAHVH